MFSYDYKGKQYIFAMNGQTGKIVGKPLSARKIAGWFAGIAGGTFYILTVISQLVAGGGYDEKTGRKLDCSHPVDLFVHRFTKTVFALSGAGPIFLMRPDC